MQECAAKGLWAVEVAYECLEVRSRSIKHSNCVLYSTASSLVHYVSHVYLQGYAKTLDGFSSSPRDAVRAAARETNRIALELGLVLVAIDAFEGYDGSTDREQHTVLLDEFRFWVELCGIMGIEQIQVPANFGGDLASPDVDLIASDLRELADIGLSVTPAISVRCSHASLVSRRSHATPVLSSLVGPLQCWIDCLRAAGLVHTHQHMGKSA